MASFVRVGTLLAVGLLSLTACSTAPTAPTARRVIEPPATPKVIAKTLHELTKGYSTVDFERFISVFAPDATYQGNVVADRRNAWEEGFSKPQYWQFSKINIYGNNAFVWFVEQSENFCAGPAVYRFNSSGLIQSVEAACAQTDPQDSVENTGPIGKGGQYADILSTGVGLGAGLVEGNPLLAGIGFPASAALKIGVMKYADTLPPQDCHDAKTGLSTVGWGAAGFNTCMILLGAPSSGTLTPICIAVGAVSGALVYDTASRGSTASCWKQLEGSDKRYQRISAAGIVPEV